MIFLYLSGLIIFSLLLVKATDILATNLRSLAKATRLGEFAITSFLLALATSLPEFFVGITSALEGEPNLSLGNVIGSNIANISLVVGGAALLGGGVEVRGTFLRRDVFYAFLAGAAPMLLLLDKSLGRVDGLILLALYGFYNVWVFAERVEKLAEGHDEKKENFTRIFLRHFHQGTRKQLGWTFLGVALLLFSADVLVHLAGKIAVIFNMPLLMIGLFLVAIGTTLPELVFELKAVRARRSEMVFGNLLGSVVANATLIIGVVSLICPIKIQAFAQYLLATIAFVFIFCLFYLFIRTKKRLERWEGAVLLAVYLLFAAIEFLH